jgi:hypothetical protein
LPEIFLILNPSWGSIPGGVVGNFHSLDSSGPEVDCASNINEHQGYPPWEKRLLVRRADNLTTFMYRLSRNFGNLNLVEP